MRKIMKKLLLAFAFLFAMSFSYAGDKGKWTGYISDSHCGAKGAKEGHESCAIKCIKGGAAPVFVVGKKVYSISDPKKVEDFIGKKVVITGEIKDKTLEIESISAATES
jgi:hypothetical protein